MEFLHEIKSSPPIDVVNLKKLITIKNLPKLCSSINSVIKNNISEGVIYCVWGEFRIHREELKYGIRFSMPECPNALAWTITSEKSGQDIVIHCTINKMTHDEDFIQSLKEFVSAWETGISQHFPATPRENINQDA